MNSANSRLQALLIAMLLSGLVACATTSIGPPTDERQALLVLPTRVIHDAHINKHGFYYVYDIVNIDDPGISSRAVLKLPLKDDILIVDSLPPGKYTLEKFTYLPLGPGDFTYGNNVQERGDWIRLERGKITIFSQSLNVRLFNRIPGRGATTSYQMGLAPLPRDQQDAIVQTLSALPNFDQWEIQ